MKSFLGDRNYFIFMPSFLRMRKDGIPDIKQKRLVLIWLARERVWNTRNLRSLERRICDASSCFKIAKQTRISINVSSTTSLCEGFPTSLTLFLLLIDPSSPLESDQSLRVPKICFPSRRHHYIYRPSYLQNQHKKLNSTMYKLDEKFEKP